jgi:invasion protein IalB
MIPAALAVPALAQTAAAPAKPAAKPVTKRAPKPAAAESAKPPAAATGGAKPTLLGQYGDWGAYTAAPAGKKVCFAIAKPSSSQTTPPNRPRNPVFMFISTRPAEKVSNEVSVVIGYPFRANSEASAEVGSINFSLYTQLDGAWNKASTEDARMIEAMRSAPTMVVKGVSGHGTSTTDTFSLKGLAQALDRTGQECK